MRFFVFALAVVWYCGCGDNKRDNPADPEAGGDGDEAGIQLVANLPEGGFAGNSSGLESIRFEVSAPDITRPVAGAMNLVGDEARVLVRDVPIGTGRVFRVDAFDANSIRTFSASDTVDVTETSPLSVALILERVVGALELTSQLPPEVDTLAVAIMVSGDTLRFSFGVESEVLQERIEDIPTGTDVAIAISALDPDKHAFGGIPLTGVRRDPHQCSAADRHGRFAPGRSRLVGCPRRLGGSGGSFLGRRLAMRSWKRIGSWATASSSTR